MIRSRGDNAAMVAGTVFHRLLYGEPTRMAGRRWEPLRAVGAITRDDVVAFHKRLFVPNNASLVVVGDTTSRRDRGDSRSCPQGLEAKRRAVAAADASRPSASTKGVTVYLVDKPAAAQSVLAVGQVGVASEHARLLPADGHERRARRSVLEPDQPEPARGQGLHLRRRGRASRSGKAPARLRPAPRCRRTTKEALVELMKELTDIIGPRPVTDDELAFAKDRLIQGFPSDSRPPTGGSPATLTDLVLYHLPDDYFTTYRPPRSRPSPRPTSTALPRTTSTPTR